MLKYILIIFISMGLMTALSGCSSSGVDDAESEVSENVDGADSSADVADEDGDDSEYDEDEDDEELADADDEDSGDLEDGEEDEEVVADLGDDELSPEAEPTQDETVAGEASELAEEGGEPIAEEAGEPMGDEGMEEVATNEDPMPVEEQAIDSNEVPEDSATDVAENAYGNVEDSEMGMGKEAYSEPEAKNWVSVRKVADAPFKKNGVLANTIYIARDGDDATSISQKVFGKEDVESIYKVNTTLRKGIKTGDKIYYNSPNRPGDSSQMMTFYEDQGLQPEVYVSKAGDNIRQVAARLLGHERSWMEVYATNDTDSKAELPDGTRLRYWSSADVAQASAPELATSEPTQVAELISPEPPVSPAENDVSDLPPPPMPQASADLPPPPAPPSADLPPPPMAVGTADSGMAPPPPPVMKRRTPRPKKVASAGDQDQTMMMGAGAILILGAAALFIILKKKRAAREIDFNTATHTQID